MCTARLFHRGVNCFGLKFYLDRLSPINNCWHQKTRDTGLCDDNDCILLSSLVLTQYRSVTDRQTDGYVVAYTAACKDSFAVGKASFAARCKTKNIIIIIQLFFIIML